jgi:hypothetical protein
VSEEFPEVLFLQKVLRLARAVLVVAAGLPAATLAQAPQYHPPVVASTDTLAGTDYNNRYELYGGLAYSHFNAGPSLLQGSNLGGIDLEGARFFSPRLAAVADVRGYFGTSGVVPNPYGIKGPFVSESMFLAGPEYRFIANERASVTVHALFGGAYGDFTSGIGKTPANLGPGTPPPTAGALGLFNNQVTFGSAIGGAIDLNRSPRLAFRIEPEATLTDFGSAGIHEQFALSVGLVYRLGRHIVAPPTRAQPAAH